jgi:hypothetical protein
MQRILHVRQVLGASAAHIVLFITKGFRKLILFSVMIGLLLAYFINRKLLAKWGCYQTFIGVVPFIAAITCLVIAFGTATIKPRFG